MSHPDAGYTPDNRGARAGLASSISRLNFGAGGKPASESVKLDYARPQL